MAKHRIAILGGGMGALSAAFALTQRPGFSALYDVTVYQPGWRLGGKCASGRDPRPPHRTEARGPHTWLGCYDSAFRMLRDCYARADWSSHSRLGTVEEAFTPQTVLRCMEQVDGEWADWILEYPLRSGVPGKGRPASNLWTCAVEWFDALAQFTAPLVDAGVIEDDPLDDIPEDIRRHLVRVPSPDLGPMEHAHLLARSLRRDPRRHDPGQHRALVWLLDAYRDRFDATRFEKPVDPPEPMPIRRMLIMSDLGATVLFGLLTDRVFERGAEAIDALDFRDWLRRHGALDLAIDSGLVRELYEASFATDDDEAGRRDGDELGRGQLSAGVAVYGMLQTSGGYAGAIRYEMNAGMGEVVVAPLYKALRDAGVKFEFFHRVDEIEVRGSEVTAIHLGQQIEVKEACTPYRPIFECDGLQSWPPHPDYAQLKRGKSLKRSGADLESRWTDWKDVARVTLERGTDFDQVILGISVGALEEICPDLAGASTSPWYEMVHRLKTVQTQAVQLWMEAPADALGWAAGPAAGDKTRAPFYVSTELGRVLATEDWGSAGPRSLHFLCGPLRGNLLEYDRKEHDVPRLALEQVRDEVTQWLDHFGPVQWPRLEAADGGFDWDALHVQPWTEHDEQRLEGADRLRAQTLRANIDPTDRYVLSMPGSARVRLEPGACGVENMAVAGDWTRTAFNAGNVEAATQSGLAAGQAIAQRCEPAWWRWIGNLRFWGWQRGLW